jgi:lipopolysaccharide export system ATP-binding protein
LLQTLAVQGLVKRFNSRTVVNHVDLQVNDNEIVGLLGPNGAGKTTSFSMIVGITRPTEGQILFNDTDITQLPMYKRSRLGVGYLAQEVGFPQTDGGGKRPRHIGNDEVEPLRVSRPPRGRARGTRVGAPAQQSGLYAFRGERRRVEIARALVTEPKFMLLDEPFSGVDPRAVEDLQVIIRQMRAKGLGVLITDHNVRETLTVTDRSYVIHEGKVMISGSAETLINDQRARELYFGEGFYMRLDNQNGEQN